MTSKKSVVRDAITRGDSEFIPFSAWYHFPESAHSGASAVAVHEQFLRETEVDFLKVMNENQHPGGNIDHVQDWRHYRPLSATGEVAQDQLRVVGELAGRFGAETMVLSTVHGLIAQLAHATGRKYLAQQTLIRDHCRQDHALMERVLSDTADALCDFVDRSLEAGADGVYYAAFGGEKHNFENEEFAQVVAPHEKRVLEHCRERGGLIFLHLCKDNLDLERYRDYSFHVLNWGACSGRNPSIAEGVRLFPDRAIMGGIDNTDIRWESNRISDIDEMVDEGLQRMAAVDRAILGTDCSVSSNIPLRNIRRAGATCRRRTARESV